MMPSTDECDLHYHAGFWPNSKVRLCMCGTSTCASDWKVYKKIGINEIGN